MLYGDCRYRKCVCMRWECVHGSMCGNVSNSSPFGASGIPAVPPPSTPQPRSHISRVWLPPLPKFQSLVCSHVTLSHSSWVLSRQGGTKCQTGVKRGPLVQLAIPLQGCRDEAMAFKSHRAVRAVLTLAAYIFTPFTLSIPPSRLAVLLFLSRSFCAVCVWTTGENCVMTRPAPTQTLGVSLRSCSLAFTWSSLVLIFSRRICLFCILFVVSQ